MMSIEVIKIFVTENKRGKLRRARFIEETRSSDVVAMVRRANSGRTRETLAPSPKVQTQTLDPK
jgi:hypothetical protein